MTKIAITTLVAAAGLASADVNLESVQDRSAYQMFNATATELGTQSRGGVGPTQYDNVAAGPGGYVAFPPSATNPLGVADYQSVAVNNIVLDEFVFVGGVDTVGETLFFDFFDAGGNFVNGFGVSLSQAGNFIWTITINSEVEVAAGGFVQMSIDTGGFVNGNGQWFLSDGAAAIGDALLEDAGGGNNHNFALIGSEVPAPGAVALLGLGGLVASRRRR